MSLQNFAPMPLAVLASKSSCHTKMLMVALYHHDWKGEKAWPSIQRLCRITSLSRASIQRSLKEAEALKWIEKTLKKGQTTCYNMRVPDMNFKEFESAIGSVTLILPTPKDGGGSYHPDMGGSVTLIPELDNTNENQKQPLEVDTSSSTQKPKKPQTDADRARWAAFDTLKKAYPRQDAPEAAKRVWKNINLQESPLETMLLALERHKRSEGWQKDGGMFIPYLVNWLRDRRWEDGIKAESPTRPRGVQL